MSTVKHRGKIVNSVKWNGSVSYTRRQPGIDFPSDSLTPEEIKELSGPVTVYKLEKKG